MTNDKQRVDMPNNGQILTDQMIAEIKAYFPRYPTRQAVTLPALHVVNEHLRHVPLEAVVEIARLLELAPADVQDTLSFYGFFKQDKPHGMTRAWVCRSVSCALRSGEEILERLCERAGIRPGQTTPQGELTIEAAECLGACDFAPCMLANETLHRNMTTESADAFLSRVGIAHQP
jgi:NADH-quinone oxidoreductase subunit E